MSIKPYTIALTGGIGSGKSTVTHRFAAYGIHIVDADLISRLVVRPGSAALAQISAHFGVSVIDATGQLDRAALRQRVFEDASQRQWLNRLLHPLIATETRYQIQRSLSAYCIWAVPLLLENNLAPQADRVLVIDVPVPVQRQRAAQRDNTSPAQIEQIIAAQVDRQTRLDAADDVIDNSGSPAQLDGQIEHLHQHYLGLARAFQR